jgi:isoleucyl-tRNA synthetase
MFQEVSARVSFPDLEQQILAFWDDRRIYQRSLELRTDAPPYVFFEGPPTANGMPHPGHCLTRVVKDVFPRYKTMRGFRCERRAGWDTHGLPVEVEVGKAVGALSKQEIEAYGVEPFIHQCIDSVFKYTKEWEELTRRLAFWVDLDDAYVTYHQSYVESVWWALKTLFERGLLYQGHKVVWWWAQGGTALSSGEVGEGYRDVDDPSIFVRFRIRESKALKPFLGEVPVSALAWTTTPWTLPSNVALAVGADVDYVLLEHSGEGGTERFLLAEALVEKTFAGLKIDPKRDLLQLAKFKGSELVGTTYERMFTYDVSVAPIQGEASGKSLRSFEIDAADFVTLDAGTGIVHIAPAFGEDDYRHCKEKGYGFLQLIKPDGTFVPEAVDVAGKFCKDADKDLIALLKERGVLLKREVYRHAYPFCPRAENDPLIQYARKSWFIRTSDFKADLLANNATMNWFPEHIREGRFGDFLRNNVDWALSRERYWGTPLPIWQCEKTARQEAISSYEELLGKKNVQGLEVWTKAKAEKPELSDHLKVHKPYIDAVTYQSPFDESARMRRVPEVVDAWFDSGSMPFAQWGYPHKNAVRFKSQFPADFISEALDQTRGWFYSLTAIGTLLQKELGGVEFPVPFKTCIVLGLMLGEDGRKLSKRLKNYKEPTYLFDKYGADALRWYLLSAQPPTSTVRFKETAIRESQSEFVLRLYHTYSFFVIYANIDGFDPTTTPKPTGGELALLDRWILGELAKTIEAVTELMDAYDSYTAAVKLNEFVDALSNWYVRRSRERFWGGGMKPDKRAAYWTLYDCLTTFAKLAAPFIPYLSEAIHRNLVHSVDPSKPESVHHCDWPTANLGAVDEALTTEMALVREIVSTGRQARANEKLKVRQPLSSAKVILSDHRLDSVVELYAALIQEELNVKSVELAENAGDYVDVEAKPNLKALGPKLGKKLPLITKAMAGADHFSIRQQIVDSGSASINLGGETMTLGPDDVMLHMTAKPGYAAATGKSCVVVLATEVTKELRLEGVARELIHHVNALRKDKGLAFDDRIRLSIVATGEIAEAVEAHVETIKAETLAVELVHSVAAETASLEIDGQPVQIGVEKV